MKRRILFAVITFALFLNACGGQKTETTTSAASTDIPSEISSEASSEAQKIDVDKNLLTIEVTIPKDLLGEEEITQESLDSEVNTEGCNGVQREHYKN